MAGILHARRTAWSEAREGEGVTLQRLCDLPSVIEVPAMRDALLTLHLAGPFLAETGVGTPKYERRWIGPGELGVSPAKTPFRRSIRGQPDVVLLHFSTVTLRSIAEEMFDDSSDSVELIPKLAVADQTAERLIGLLFHEAVSPELGAPLMVESLTRAIMVHVLRTHSNLSNSAPQTSGAISPGRVKRVVEYMRENLDKTLRLTELAAIANLSPSRFVRAFHTAVGKPPHRFLIQLRIEEACRLLEESDLPVIEVGLRCGFEQPSHFASMFRNVVGMPPSVWRRERLG
jgi:AraC family transcriptional regulator